MLNDETRLAQAQATSATMQDFDPQTAEIIINNNLTDAQQAMNAVRISDWDGFLAGFRATAAKDITGAYDWFKNAFTALDTDYNPYKDPLLVQEGNDFINKYAEEFTDAKDSELTREKITKIRAWEENQQMIEAGGASSVFGMFAGIPSNLSVYIPIGGLAGAGSTAVKARNILTSLVGASAAYNFGQAYTDPSIDGGDALQNTLIDTIIGGMMFGAGYALSASGREGVRKLLSGTATEQEAAAAIRKATPTESTVGAMETPTAPEDAFKIYTPNAGVRFLNWLGKNWSPSRRAALAEPSKVNELGEKMYENTWHTKGTVEGTVSRPDSIEVVKTQLNFKKNPVLLELDSEYTNYKKLGGKLDQADWEQKIEELTLLDTPLDKVPDEFKKAFEARAKYYRDMYIELQNEGRLPRLVQLQDNRILKQDDIENAADQLRTLERYKKEKRPDREKITAAQKEVDDLSRELGINLNRHTPETLSKLIKRQGPDVLPGGRRWYAPHIINMDKVMTEWDGAINAYARGFMKVNDNLSLDDALEVAQEMLEGIIYENNARVYESLSYTPKFLKKRTLNIDIGEVLPYMQTDLRHNIGLYSNQVSADLAIKKVFGTNNFDEVLGDIEELYNDKIIEASKLKDAKKVEKLQKEKAQILDDFKNNYLHFTGKDTKPIDRYSVSYTAFEAAKTVQTMTKMGLSAFYVPIDMLNTMLSNKMVRNYGEDLSKFMNELKKSGASKEELALVGIGFERWTSDRIRHLGDIDEHQLGNRALLRKLHAVQSGFFHISLTSPLTDIAREIDYNASLKFMIASSRYIINKADAEDLHTLKNVLGEGKGTEFLDKELRRMGIDPANAQKISDAYEANKVVDKDGRVFYNVQNWGDIGTRIQRSAIREMNMNVLIPGLGDKPEWSKTPLGKVAFQFKGFFFGAYNKQMTRSWQEMSINDSEAAALAWARIVGMTMGGSLVYATRELIKGNTDIDLSARRLIAEGLDRGGAFPLFDFMNSIADRIGFGTGSLLGAKPVSRYKDQSLTDQIFGPTAGTANEVYNLLGKFARGDATTNDYRAAARLLPGSNLPYFVGLTNSIGRD